ncbi:MAG: glycosyltransferase [Armatimonadetes bacterium]|nr:glycosyltransferase [Armatimonadota bacterium]MDW8122229.1 glycosyltransferase [Armatimonadota bacterium]
MPEILPLVPSLEMKLAVVTECYHPIRNGVVAAIDWSVTTLRRSGHQVRIFAPHLPLWTDPGSDVVRIPSVGNPFYPLYPAALPWSSVLKDGMKKWSPDIVHTHSFFWLSRWALNWAQKISCPVVSTFHTRAEEYVHYGKMPPFLSRLVVIHWMKSFYRRCDAIFVVSPLTEAFLRKIGVHVPVFYTPTGVDDNLFRPRDRVAIRRSFHLPSEGILMAYSGRLAKEKNLPFLLQALAPLLRKRRDCYLLLIGNGPLRRELQSVAVRYYNLENQVLFFGSQPRERVAQLLSGSDFFVFPSTTETQGLAVIEAMMSGLPVVAVNAGGPACYVENGKEGFLTAENENDFQRAVERLLDDPQIREKMGTAARQKATRLFSFAVCAESLERAYRAVLQKSRVSGTDQ